MYSDYNQNAIITIRVIEALSELAGAEGFNLDNKFNEYFGVNGYRAWKEFTIENKCNPLKFYLGLNDWGKKRLVRMVTDMTLEPQQKPLPTALKAD